MRKYIHGERQGLPSFLPNGFLSGARYVRTDFERASARSFGRVVTEYQRNTMSDTEQTYHKYRCYLRSASGMWECYDGYVDIFAANEDDVFTRAVQQLARTSFPDRPSMSSWRLERIERLNS